MIISGGTTKTFIEKDSYLIIVSGDNKDDIFIQEYEKNTANNSQNLLNNKLGKTLGNIALMGYTSPIAQNYASKIVSNATLGRINSSIYDIMADGQISNQEVAEDFIGSCTNALDNMFTDLGFPTPSALYSAISPNGSGVISKDLTSTFLKLFSNQSQNEIISKNKESSELKNIIIIKLKLVQSDNESLPISIPTRKTENNFNIATSINNNNPERSFETVIVHNERKNINMYEIKSQLKKIREEKKHVNIYVCDNDVKEIEILNNYLLSNLDFSVRDANSLDCSISFAEVPQWTVKIDTSLDKSLGYNSSSGGNGGVGSNKNKRSQTSDSLKNKSTEVQSIQNFTFGTESSYDWASNSVEQYNKAKLIGNESAMNHFVKSLTDAANMNKANFGHKFSETEVRQILDAGGKAIKI